MSGQARRVPLLDGEGGWDQFWLQCHQPLIGAPSPVQANQPWYPTVIFPTTSPGALAARLGRADHAPAAARPAPATVDTSTDRREIPMWTLLCGAWAPGPPTGRPTPGDQDAYTSNSESWPAGQPVFAVMVSRRYRWVPALKVMATVLPVAGLNV